MKTPVEFKETIIKITSEITNRTLEIDYCWLVNIKPNENGVTHNHPTYPFVGVYYVSSPEKCGNLIFNEENYQIVPENDMLVVFPGTTLHSIDYNRTQENRISIGTHFKISEKINV